MNWLRLKLASWLWPELDRMRDERDHARFLTMIEALERDKAQKRAKFGA